ncbi:MAG: thioredoxin [Thermoprotei archaeon]|nr:MAG: thioredoxin [Thermoprotei archaeon]
MSEEDKELEVIKKRMLRELMEGRKEVLDKPIEVGDHNIEEVVKKNPLVIVDCWAVWCPPCRLLAPVIDELAKRYAGKVVFGKLDVDVNPATIEKYAIMEVPTLLVFKNGNYMGKIIGYRPLPQLEELIRRYL